MRLRRLLLLALASSALAALYRVVRRRPQARVDLYFEDGSLSSLAPDDPKGALLLSLARDVRRAAA